MEADALLACFWRLVGEELSNQSSSRFLCDMDVQKDPRPDGGARH